MTIFTNLSLLLIGISFSLSDVDPDEFDYCKLCSPPAIHTMCAWPTDKLYCAGTNVSAGLTDAQRKELLHSHNVIRQQVATGTVDLVALDAEPQPTASNMMKVRWHYEAERIAQRWTNRCFLGHDECRNTRAGYAGQNAYMGACNATAVAWAFMVEIAFMMPGMVEELRIEGKGGESVGHYTQMVWATVEGIGCGWVRLPTYTNSRSCSVICNYVPGGNVAGQGLYKIGEPCSECPDQTHCSKKYPGLCARDDDDEAEFEGASELAKSNFLLLYGAIVYVYVVSLNFLG